MIKFLMIFLLTLQAAFAQDACDISNPQVTLSGLAENVTSVNEAFCKEKSNDRGIDIPLGCLSGGGHAGKDLAQGFATVLKMFFWDIPKAAYYDGAYLQIKKLLASDMKPADMVSAIANTQIHSKSEIYESAKRYWEAFKTFSGNVMTKLKSSIKGFHCLPLKEQSKIVCRIISEGFLLVLTPVKFFQGAKYVAESSVAVKALLEQAKVASGLTLVGRLNAAAVTLKEANHTIVVAQKATAEAEKLKVELAHAQALVAQAQREAAEAKATTAALIAKEADLGKEVLKLRNSSLYIKKMEDGSEAMYYVRRGKDGKALTPREVPLDAKTLAIDSNSDIGKMIIRDILASKKGKKSILVSMDFNHLGKVNHFEGMTGTGDRYLAGGARSIKESMREGEILFKNGGDELLTIVDVEDARAAQTIIQRMINNFDKNPEIKEIFKREVRKISQRYRDVNTATSYASLPKETRLALNSAEKELAQNDFEKFRVEKLELLALQLVEQARIRGSISVGSTWIRAEDSLETVLARADTQADTVKAKLKHKYGLNISDKVKVDVSDMAKEQAYGPATALPPVE
jgi:GGDEF domain-containing protein